MVYIHILHATINTVVTDYTVGAHAWMLKYNKKL